MDKQGPLFTGLSMSGLLAGNTIKPEILETLNASLDNVNYPAVFCYLRHYLRIRKSYEAAMQCDGYSEIALNADGRNMIGIVFSNGNRELQLAVLAIVSTKGRFTISRAALTALSGSSENPLDFFRTAKAKWFVPKLRYCTEEFLEQLSSGKKFLFKNIHVKNISVPKYPEFDFEVCSEAWEDYPELAFFLPDKHGEGRAYDRDFFFNVVNTAYPDVVTRLVNRAHEERAEAKVSLPVPAPPPSTVFAEFLSIAPKLAPGKKSKFSSQKVKYEKIPYNYEMSEECSAYLFRVVWNKGKPRPAAG
jgi:hypothetical protein